MTNGDDSPDGAYLTWLYSKVGSVMNRNPERSFWQLCKQLYSKQYVWFIPNDDNRVEDGRDLRILFLEETGYPLDDPFGVWMEMGCSMLEMLIALAGRASFDDEHQGSPLEWFWRFLGNLELDRYSDDIFEISIAEEVEDTLDRLNNRTYSPEGLGGLFPLRYNQMDQRRVELWHQMSAYLLEGEYVNSRPRW